MKTGICKMEIYRLASLWLLLQINITSASWDTEMRWCQYKIFTNPKTWFEAREMCRSFNMKLLHISDVDTHNYLTSMFQTSMLHVHPYESSFMFWLGLHKPQYQLPSWQDNGGSITLPYSPVGRVEETELCFLFRQNDSHYETGRCCEDIHPFICESTVFDLIPCYSTTDQFRDASSSPLYYPVPSYTDCFSNCYAPDCVGFRYFTTGSSCICFHYKQGYTYVKGLAEDKYVKAIFITDDVQVTYNTPCVTQQTSEQPQILQTSTTTYPEYTTHTQPAENTYGQQLATTTVSVVTFSTTTSSVLNVKPDDNHEVTEDSLYLQTTRTINPEIETKLEDLFDRVAMETEYSNTDLINFSKELKALVTSYPQGICLNLEMVIGIEKKITLGAILLHPDSLCDIIDIFHEVLSIIGGYTNTSVGCTSFITKTDILAFEDILVQLSKLAFTRTNSEQTGEFENENTAQVKKANCSFEHEGISMRIFFEDGENLTRHYRTSYGGFSFQHTSTLQQVFSNQRVLVFVISYKEDRWRNFIGQDNISSSVVKTGVYDSEGKLLTNLGDSVVVEVQDFSVPGNTNDIKIEMLPFGSEFMMALPAGLVESGSVLTFIDVSSTESCQIYGKYGTRLPTHYDYDLVVLTRQDSEVTKYRPYDLSFTYTSSILQLTIISAPVIITTKCLGSSQRLRRSLQSGNSSSTRQIVPTVSTRIVEPKVWNDLSGKWQSRADLKTIAGKPSEVTLESFFFGAFSASVKWIPPDMIDFRSVFLNFSEKLNDTPYVLATIVSVLVIMVVLSPFLRYLDQKDSKQWTYQHLVDNKIKFQYKYYLLLSTGLRSARTLTSSVYINIIGSRATTGTRLLSDGSNKNFGRGTSCHFCLTTDKDLGHVETIQIWHDDSGKSTSWFLNTIVLCEGETKKLTVLCCNKWLSVEKDGGQVWQALNVYKNCNPNNSLSDAGSRRLFDDNLWFSLLYRPHYSRFTRVQRLWCAMSLLFLSMVTSAMFYDTPDVSVPLIRFDNFEIAYKDLYVGLMSSVITVLPGIIMIYIFNNRELHDEKRLDIEHDGHVFRSSGYLPWWFIFIAYGILLLSITAGSFFTFLYSLEWGSAITLKWMVSFFLGTTEGVVFVEPAKAFILAMMFVSFCSGKLDRKLFNLPPLSTYVIKEESSISTVKNPCYHPPTQDQKRRRRMVQLERKAYSVLKEWIVLMLYLCAILLIGSHQRIHEGYRQNTHLSNVVQPSQKISNIEDIWTYLEHTLLGRLSALKFYNGDVIPYLSQKFVGSYYKLGPIRLRQVRVTGVPCVSSMIVRLLSKCNPEVKHTEDTSNYIEGWMPIRESATTEDHTPFTYRTADITKSVTYMGTFDTYSGGGYLFDVDIEPANAVSSVLKLKNQDWLDTKTHALFVEVLLMNANTMLFSRLQVLFEFPSFGDVFTDIVVETSNVYPYINTLDYVVLLLQVLFIIVTFGRFILLIIAGIQSRCRCFLDRNHVVQILTIAVSFTAIGCFLMQIISTINGLNTLHVEEGFLTSFGEVFLWNQYYSICVGIITFIAILDLLKVLTFNYHFYLLYRTISAFLWEFSQLIITFCILTFGFAAFIRLLYGNLDADYKSVPEGVMSLFRMTIGMLKLRHLNNQMKDEGALIIFGLFAVVVTIVFINLFVSALNHGFNAAKIQIDKHLTDFDVHLNRYIWHRFISVFTCSSPTDIQIDDDDDDDDDESEKSCQPNGNRKRKMNLKKGEKTVTRLCSTLTKYYDDDAVIERNMFTMVLAKVLRKGPTFLWRKILIINRQLKYTFSTDEIGRDEILTVETIPTKADKRMDVERVSIKEATRMGLIPYGTFTKPLSQFYIIHRQNDGASKCTVSLRLEQPSWTAYFIVKPTLDTDWEQHSTSVIQNEANEPVRSIAVIPRCPCYILAVSCARWVHIPPHILHDRKETFVLQPHKLSIMPSSPHNLCLTFPEDAVEKPRTSIEIVMETAGVLPIFHLLSSKDIRLPLRVSCEDRRNRDELSIENFMEIQILTKDGDLEWKLENTKLHVNRRCITFNVNNIRKGVKKAVAVMLSDYRISFSEPDNAHLDREKHTLLGIYRDRIRTKHWRHIGTNLSMTRHYLSNLDSRKPRSLQEKVCMVLGRWLKENPSRSLRHIQSVWN